MSEETPTPESAEETAPQVFSYTAGTRNDGKEKRTGPVELVYTPNGWVIKE